MSHSTHSNNGLQVKAMARRNNIWEVWKHALGSYSEQDGYKPENDDTVAYIRTFIVGINVLCGIMIIINIVRGWML